MKTKREPASGGTIYIYEMTLCFNLTLVGHGISNQGSKGFITEEPRRQLLADGTETDAISGGLYKHYHAFLLAEMYRDVGVPLCSHCAWNSSLRAAGLTNGKGNRHRLMEKLLGGCGVCDVHGFLVPGKKKKDDSDEERDKVSKGSLVEFSMGLADPNHFHETEHLYTRSGKDKEAGQMWFKRRVRSAKYGFVISYRPVQIGMDVENCDLIVTDQDERLRRHRACLVALRDLFLNPPGAHSATQKPQLMGLSGAIATRLNAEPPPAWSPLDPNFQKVMSGLETGLCPVVTFNDPVRFF